jgi:hypothetical protein
MNFKQLKMNLKHYASILLLSCSVNKFFQFVSAWLCVGKVSCFVLFLLQKINRHTLLTNYYTTPVPIIAGTLFFKNRNGNIYPKQFNHESKNIF